MAIQSFSRSCSSFFSWAGGICDVTFSSDSSNTGRSTSRDRICELLDNGASVDATVFNTVCHFGVRGGSVALHESFRLPTLRGSWVDPIRALANLPFVAPTAYIGLRALLNSTWELPPGSRTSVYRFVRREAQDAALRARDLRHDALAIRITVKVVSFVADADGDGEEESVFWEEAQAGAGEGACAVCLEEMEEGKTVARLRCGHAFDKRCISRWLERKMQCPVCRSDVEEIV